MVPEKDFDEVCRRLRGLGIPLPNGVTQDGFAKQLEIVLLQLDEAKAAENDDTVNMLRELQPAMQFSSADDLVAAIRSKLTDPGLAPGQWVGLNQDIDPIDAACMVDEQAESCAYLAAMMKPEAD